MQKKIILNKFLFKINFLLKLFHLAIFPYRIKEIYIYKVFILKFNYKNI